MTITDCPCTIEKSEAPESSVPVTESKGTTTKETGVTTKQTTANPSLTVSTVVPVSSSASSHSVVINSNGANVVVPGALGLAGVAMLFL